MTGMTKLHIFALALSLAMLAGNQAAAAQTSAAGGTISRYDTSIKSDSPTSRTLVLRSAGEMPIQETPKPNLLYVPGWNRIPAGIERAPDEKTLEIPAMHNGKMTTLEQRRYPLRFASPMIVDKAFRKVITRNLAKIRYDAATAEFIVIDLPESHERLWRYLQAMDTPKPARLFTVSPDKIGEAKKKLTEALSPEGEITPFEDEGVLIARDSAENIPRLEKAVFPAPEKRLVPLRAIERHVNPATTPASMPAEEAASQPSQAVAE
jgi:hypothetical protein